MKSYVYIFLKGIAMGAADVVPGVSGGTIAFITGIYDRLLGAISQIDLSLIPLLFKGDFRKIIQKIDAAFLLSLLLGILTSILTLSKLIKHLMHHYPIVLWAFFFGLIMASILYVGKELKGWNFKNIAAVLLGTLVVIALTIMPPIASSQTFFYLIFCGSIASCAMILPGISGSFILLLLGIYPVVITAIGDLTSFEWSILRILLFMGIGIIIGLLSFSRFLKYLLTSHHQVTIATLTGFLIGSLWKIWPWKLTHELYIKDIGIQPMGFLSNQYQSLTAVFTHTNGSVLAHGIKAHDILVYSESNILPQTYTLLNTQAENHIWFAIIAALVGFSLIFIIEKIALRKNSISHV